MAVFDEIAHFDHTLIDDAGKRRAYFRGVYLNLALDHIGLSVGQCGFCLGQLRFVGQAFIEQLPGTFCFNLALFEVGFGLFQACRPVAGVQFNDNIATFNFLSFAFVNGHDFGTNLSPQLDPAIGSGMPGNQYFPLAGFA